MRQSLVFAVSLLGCVCGGLSVVLCPGGVCERTAPPTPVLTVPGVIPAPPVAPPPPVTSPAPVASPPPVAEAPPVAPPPIAPPPAPLATLPPPPLPQPPAALESVTPAPSAVPLPPQTPSSAVSSPQLLLQGRFSPGPSSTGVASLPQTISWPGSSVYTSFQSTSITVVLQALPQDGMVTYGINWFRFFIDGEAALDGFTSYNQLNLTVTIPTSAGAHTLRIAKLLEGGKGEAILSSITLAPGGSFLSSPSGLPAKRMLFLGDSYLVGFGDAGAVDNTTCAPTASQVQPDWTATCTALNINDAGNCANFWEALNENNLAAFGPVTAAAFDADFQVIARSGSGLIGYQYAQVTYPGQSIATYETYLPSDAAMFNRSVYSEVNSLYPTSSWIPQVVVVAGGTNDWQNAPNPDYTVAQWADEAAAFLQQMSSDFNQPAIIILVFPPDQQMQNAPDVRTGFEQTMQYEQAMTALYSEATTLNIPNVHLLQLTSLGYDAYENWCDSHPSAVAQAAVASQIATLVSSIEPSWNASSIDMNPPQSVLRPNTALYMSGSDITTFAGGPSAGAGSASSPLFAPVVLAGLQTAG